MQIELRGRENWPVTQISDIESVWLLLVISMSMGLAWLNTGKLLIEKKRRRRRRQSPRLDDAAADVCVTECAQRLLAIDQRKKKRRKRKNKKEKRKSSQLKQAQLRKGKKRKGIEWNVCVCVFNRGRRRKGKEEGDKDNALLNCLLKLN